MAKYDINKHSRRIFPWFWQNPTNMSLVDTLMSVFSNVNDDYEVKETDTRQRVGYSIQRLSLESSLNDRFDPVQRRIVVDNSNSAGGGGFIFNESESISANLELFIFNEGESLGMAQEAYLFNNGESSGSAISPFRVIVPTEYSSQEQYLRAWIEFVQVFGTEYTLIFM